MLSKSNTPSLVQNIATINTLEGGTPQCLAQVLCTATKVSFLQTSLQVLYHILIHAEVSQRQIHLAAATAIAPGIQAWCGQQQQQPKRTQHSRQQYPVPWTELKLARMSRRMSECINLGKLHILTRLTTGNRKRHLATGSIARGTGEASRQVIVTPSAK